MFKTTQVFQANYESKESILINQGGTSSSKTWSIIQVLITRAMYEPYTVISVVGENFTSLRKGAYRDIQAIHAECEPFKRAVKFWNRSSHTIFFKNGSLIEFLTGMDEQAAKSGKRDYLFLNEANGQAWAVFWQLAIRTRKQIYIDYNPSAPFWAHDNLIGTGPRTNDLSATVKLIISDHRHNSFLTEQEHAKIEGIKDETMWKVYARGMTGNVSGLIFPNWTRIEDNLYPWSEPFFGGLDFGYTNDPTAGIKIARVGESIYLHEMCYTPGIAPKNMKQILWSNGFTSEVPVYCENDPDQINQLRHLEVWAVPAIKGPGSVKSGILQLQNDYKVFYTASSQNLHMERQRYVWMKDPINGKITNTPLDQFNHLMDATRYGVHTHYFRKQD